MKQRILIVDDEPDVLRMVGIALHRSGFEAVAARSGNEAVERVSRGDIDLVVLDVLMTGMDGLDTCRRIRDLPGGQRIPILMVSGRGEVQDKIAGFHSGADDYVTKPFDMKELVVRVETLIARTRRLSEQVIKDGKVLGFVGAKGGVGTTSVAVNVAFALAKLENDVILVELTPGYGSLAAHLGRVGPECLDDLLKLEVDRIDRAAVERRLILHEGGVRVLHGPYQPSVDRVLEVAQVNALMKVLQTLADYVVVDLPSQPLPSNQPALKFCEQVTLVVGPEPDAVQAAKAMHEQLLAWDVLSSAIHAVVVNRSPVAVGINLEEIREYVTVPILAVVPHAADASRLALQQNTPLVVSRRHEAAASSLIDIADKLTTVGAVGGTVTLRADTGRLPGQSKPLRSL